MTKLVEPPIAAFTRIAFSNASRVRISDGLRFSFTMSTIRAPEYCANTLRLLSAAGIAALEGSVNPNDSTIQAIVEAVPITAQCPALLHIQASATVNCS